MSGFIVELDDSNDYNWRESMVTFIDSDELFSFLEFKEIPLRRGLSGMLRLYLTEAMEYLQLYPSLSERVRNWRRNRFLRLGRRSWTPIHKLTESELSLVMIDDDIFDLNYIVDPRGPLTFSEVMYRKTRHPPVLVGVPQSGMTALVPSPRPGFDFTPRVRPHGKAVYLKPRLRDSKGRPLSSKTRLLNRVRSLFYSLPLEGRRAKIPSWLCEVLNKPRYLFRIRGKDLSVQQKVISTLCRVYHWYRFHYSRQFAGTAKLIKFCRDDKIYRILSHPMGEGWFTMASIAYRRLKVLLKPLWA
jgi:hypothetical protein